MSNKAKAALVEQIKTLQREGAREQWGAYCESNGTSKRDPNAHDASFLSAFIVAYNAGQTFSVNSSDLAAQVKAIQREGGKQQWWNYCDTHGDGTRDPSKHDESFLQGFIATYNPAANVASSGDGSMADLIKKAQRGSTNFKNAWAEYCAIHGNGKNDPTKHNEAYIIGFLDNLAGGGGGGSYGSAPASKKGGGGGPYGGGKGGAGGINMNTKVNLGALLQLLGAAQ